MPTFKLTNAALARSDAPAWATAAADHVASMFEGRSRAVPAPYVGVVQAPRDGSRLHSIGRYFPSKNAILAVEFPGEHDLVRGVVAHELGHWAVYCTLCRSHRRTTRCGYSGDHDASFYEVVEPIYRALHVPVAIARRVDGYYDFPARWKRMERWAS